MLRTYEAPERSPLINTVFGIAAAVLWTFFISYVYGFVIAVSPLVYINFFITAGFGFCIGYGIKLLFRLFTIVNKQTAVKTALACSVMAIYFSWVAYIIYFLDQESPAKAYFFQPLLLFSPQDVWAIMVEINTHGLWQIFGIPFNGWVLSLIWLIEAGIIIAVPPLLLKNMSQAPYSASLKKWYKKYVLFKDFESIAMTEQFKKDLSTDCVRAINALNNGLAYHFARVTIYYLENENEQYITVENVEKDRQGKNEQTKEIVHLMLITKGQAMTLKEKYHAKRITFFDFY